MRWTQVLQFLSDLDSLEVITIACDQAYNLIASLA